MAYLMVDASTAISLTMRCYGISGEIATARHCVWNVMRGSQTLQTLYDDLDSYASVSVITIDGLSAGVTYTIACNVWNTDWTAQLDQATGEFSTYDVDPIAIRSCTVSRISGTYVQVSVTTNVTIDYYWIQEGSTYYDEGYGGGSSGSWTIDLSTPGTHSIKVTVQGLDQSRAAATRDITVYTTISATVTYDANGGSGAPSPTTASEESSSSTGTVSITLSSTKPTKSGMTFTQWLINRNVGLKSAGETFDIAASSNGINYTATAQWSASGSGKVFIWNGSAWKPATAYIYNGGWKLATPYIYNSGWK